MATLEETFALVETLSPLEKVKLMERLAASLRKDIEENKPPKSLYGLWTDLGPAPSAEEIDEARREVWSNFPREDIG